jgi:hypothetical protein
MTHRPWVLASLLVTACASAPQRMSAPPAAMAMGVQGARPQAPEAPHPAVSPPAQPPTQPEQSGYYDVNTDNALISNGSVAATSDHLLQTASGFRRELYRLGGRVYSEQIHYTDTSDDASHKVASSATYRIKILPRLLPDLLDYLGKHATITQQDVSSIIAMESEGDAAIVRADVQARVTEIDQQLASETLDPQYRAALDIERAKLVGATIADPNAQADNTKRVAVLEVRLEAPRIADPFARGKMLGHARGSFLDFDLLGTTSASRFGGGVGIGGKSPISSLEVIGYAANDAMEEKAAVSVSLGFGTYSKAFGGGKGTSMNPYIGARLGYAYFDASFFTVAAEIGVELFKQHGVMWTVSARPMGLVGNDSKAALELGTALGLAL